MSKKNTPEAPTTSSGEREKGSLIMLAEQWEDLAASWIQVARDRNDDAPDIANRAQARAAIYLDCAEDLKANPNNMPPPGLHDSPVQD